MLSTFLLAALLAAGQADAPAPPAPSAMDAPDSEHLLEPDDYPQFALIHDLSAASVVEVFVSPQGRVIDCKAGKSWGDNQLADGFCDILKYKHQPPAHDAQGKPAYGLVRGLARLIIPGTGDGDRIRPIEAPADVEMETPHLPGGLDRTEVRLLLWVSPEGVVQDCRPGKGEGQLDLVTAICPAARKLTPGQHVGIEGFSVPYVMSVKAALVAQDARPVTREPGLAP
ncbi:hypothetical protein [Novosphingobium rosa]|uniref:hypothetical protein n=1 Tax=Novosphingobium rosa TaxID=76978 RepID=UPI00083174E7|nr:hypothetical protein [Novosphingobium rosa]